MHKGEWKMDFKVSEKLIDDASKIRLKVFKEEQGFKQEFDDIDNIATHIVGYLDNKAIATCRIFSEGNSYHIGRFAIIKEYRGRDYGIELMKKAEQVIKDLGGKKIELSSQLRAKNFYEKCGFKAEGEIYMDEFCPHILMKKEIE